jgi:RHS repeat-associated protein
MHFPTRPAAAQRCENVYCHCFRGLVWYEGGGSGRRFYADHQGSIVAIAHPTNAWLAINGYDSWGIPNPSNAGRFQYTGQVWLPELDMYYYKARVYSPTLGRFLQTDPIGYGDGMNLYAYVGGDPVNSRDPMGLCMITIWGRFRHNEDWSEVEELDRWATSSGCGPAPYFSGGGPGDGGDSAGSGEPGETPADTGEIVITGTPIVFRASVEIRYIDGLALWNHFINGGGETLCLSRSQFAEIVTLEGQFDARRPFAPETRLQTD